MKPLILLFLILCLLSFGACGNDEPAETPLEPAPPPQQPAEEPTLLDVATVVDAIVVNVRMEPNTEARILDTVRRGEMFEIIGLSEDGQWYRIFFHGDPAYISADYIYPAQWPEGEALTLGRVINAEGAVNVRASASTSGEILLAAQDHEQFVVTAADSGSGWHQLSYQGEPAYISAEFLLLEQTTIDQVLYQ